MLPSKELLSAVLKRKVKEEIGKVFINNRTLTFTYEVGGLRSDINIFELMHLMKEWIRSEGYEIQIKMIERDGNVFIEFVDWRNGDSVFGNDVFKGRTEWEAMVIFAEWVLEQQNVSK